MFKWGVKCKFILFFLGIGLSKIWGDEEQLSIGIKKQQLLVRQLLFGRFRLGVWGAQSLAALYF